MAPRFDFEAVALELSVADLLDHRLSRSLGFANRGGYERMWLGQAIHSRYQEQALADDPTYRREVALSYVFQHRGWEIRLAGRVDGLRKEPDGRIVVEEIKSVRRGGKLAPAVLELYQRQALIYAWMLHRRDEIEVAAELVLIEIGGDEEERQVLTLDLATLEASIKQRLNGLIRAAEGERIAAEQRREAGDALAFPYGDRRPGQDEIEAAVETALDHREHLLLEATTGIGKTVAALYPALRYALRHGKRLYVLTAKTLQQEMAMTVLDLLNRGAFSTLRIRAKAKMCANDQIICHEEYCPYAKDYYQKLVSSGVLGQLLGDNPSLEPDAVYDAARQAEVCPFEVSLELAGRVQVVVGDYNYAFDPYVALSDFGSDSDLSDTVLVVDEIHNLVDRGRGYYSPHLSALAARAAGEAIGHGGERIHLRLASLCSRLATLIEAAVEDEIPPGGGDRAAQTALPEDELWKLRPAFDAGFVDYLEYRRETKSFTDDDPFVQLYFDYLRFLNVLVLSDSTFSHCVERVRADRMAPGDETAPGSRRRGREDRRLKILCRDPSPFLGKVINRCHTVVGLSATLSPPEFYRDLLGFEAGRTAAVSIPDPFPAGNRRVVIDTSVATTYRERPANYQPIADRLAELAESVPGNCLALFPSYRFLAEVADRLPRTSKRVLVQQRANSDREREEILDALRSALFADVLLLAVAGGVFAEGVDYPGDMLKAVAVVGPCLPALTLEQQLLKEYYQERFERGFEYAFVVPGMTRVVQAAGRLIRSPTDTGVIALLDRRFLSSPYREHLPSGWLPDEGAAALSGRPARIAGDFFAEV